MELWKTKEKHIVRKRSESHRVRLCIPNRDAHYIERGLAILRAEHNMPDDAHISISGGWNCYLNAFWSRIGN